MNTEEIDRKDYLLLCVKHALGLWEISPSVRAINVERDKYAIDIYFIYDGFILDDDREVSECVATQVLADSPSNLKEFQTHHVRCDFPKELPKLGWEAYRRDEKDYEKMLRRPVSRKKNIQLSILNALILHYLSSSVRSINFQWEQFKHSIDLYFVYDKTITKDAKEISEAIANQVLADFSDLNTFHTHHIQCDLPHPIPQFGVEAYRREEQNNECQPSLLTYPDPEALLREYAGTGKSYGSEEPGDLGFMELIECNEIIGEWFNKRTKKFYPTKRATIHYDREGTAFIIPSNPKPFVEASILEKLFFYFTKKYFRKSLLRLSIKFGLDRWGVSPDLQEVRIGCDKVSIDIYFIYDSFPCFDARVVSECAATEVQADFSFEPIRTHHLISDLPNSVLKDCGQECVYRKEKNWEEKFARRKLIRKRKKQL